MFYDNSERKKKAKRLWQEFRDIECMITEPDSNYFEFNSKYVKDVLQFMLDCEAEFNGLESIYLQYPTDLLEKAIQEIKDYYNNK